MSAAELDQDGRTVPEHARGVRVDEDWVATIVGLVLLALALAGTIPAGLVP
jgi:hypothetical protein